MQHRAKHRAAGSATAAVAAATLIERYALVPAARPEASPSRHGVATLPAPAEGAPSGLFGAMPYTSPMLLVADDATDAASRDAGTWFAVDDPAAPVDGPDDGDSPLFGAARHARSRVGAAVVPAPRLSGTSPSLRAVRPQPMGTAISATVLGAAAAVTAVVVPVPSGVETTGSMQAVQEAAPASAPDSPIGHALAAPAPNALPDQPTVQIPALVDGIRAEMAKAAPAVTTPAVTTPYATVASTTALGSSPAAMMRRAAMTTALGRLGKPYRWGAMGPNAFDCSGLVKWSFANVGRTLPRTSRAMAGVGTPVSRNNLQPGDLVFFYQPISHVGIYIGNNKIVHASQTGQPVKISDITYMRFTAARRVV